MNESVATETKSKRLSYVILFLLAFIIVLFVFSGKIMTTLGLWLVLDEEPVKSDVVVVLNTGAGWYPRVMEAAALYRKGFAEKVVVNGNRKTQIQRELEGMGLERCCPWYEHGLRVLALLGVPRDAVITVSAEDAYDTVSEAKAVGQTLIDSGVSSVIVTTSKYHTRRSHHIWQYAFPRQFSVCTVAASNDPYSPQSWWKEGRQIRWVMAEYGAWIYYFWKRLGRIQQ